MKRSILATSIAIAAVALSLGVACSSPDVGSPRAMVVLDPVAAAPDSKLWERHAIPETISRDAALATSPDGSLVLVDWTHVARSRDDAASWDILTIPEGETVYSNRGGGTTWVDRATIAEPYYAHGPLEPTLKVVEAATNGSRLLMFARGSYATAACTVPLSAAFGRLDRKVFLAKGGLVDEDGAYNGPRVASFDAFDRPLLAGAIDDRAVLYTSEDAGATWKPIWQGAPGGARVLAVRMKDAMTGYLVLSDGVVARTSDSMRSWQIAGVLPPTVASRARAMCPVLGSGLCVVGDDGQIAISDDDGHTWRVVDPVSKASLLDVEALGATLWAVGEAGTVLESRNAGATWREVNLPIGATIDSVHVARNRAWVVTDRDLYCSPQETGGTP